MAELEKVLNELPKLVEELKLTVGNTETIQQELTRLSEAQEKLHNLQVAIAQELDVTKSHQNGCSAISAVTARTLLIPDNFSTDNGFIAEKFGSFNKQLSLTELQAQMVRWHEWGELLQSIAKDMLSDEQIINQLNCNINYTNIPEKFREIEQIIPINLAFGNQKKLEFQNKQIITYQSDLLEIQQRLSIVFDSINSSQTILVILLGLSLFCGQNGLELQWLSDEYGFIISSMGKFQPLTEFINDCESYKNNINTLVENINSLKTQTEQAIVSLPQSDPLGKAAKYLARKRINSILFIASSVLVLGLGGWTIYHQITQFQSGNVSGKQPKNVVDKFKASQKLGLEASLMVQKPPLPLKDWQQAESKWQQAVQLLESIPEGTPVSPQAKKQLISYRTKYAAISQKVLNEKKAATNLEYAQKLAVEAEFIAKNAPPESVILQQAKDKLQAAINLLQSIPEGTSVSKEVQDKLTSYQNSYEAIGSK
ncbi:MULTISPECIES: hypothetical protein [unclassified Tolypothrix]|uniref:hypothetical protein n=1 Tax=unclassified Tolypothrix TaxID=2649714 RepID=UPI0005EAA345|nr:MULTISPECIES: hypothetical protein [unclassified Tolypothrix]BAY91107.1 hypothetical protein NIES3275_31290 [Microchaete diplosiphon NIES-3275]EKE99971.1 hypothetical protein FDUTEX481_09494 [Tolypothrix sp. PCC 7601]MBE9087531.1 hypothetical protein [Tolypothrix sp. LEGE 11397]UYD25204.1 hypothetical protein HGR01_28035 [Tolypothrix sp. PCC 7712]UYD32557.1 hypothetical protein HG267_26575 [Tolypothrix sp. PCC 7601]